MKSLNSWYKNNAQVIDYAIGYEQMEGSKLPPVILRIMIVAEMVKMELTDRIVCRKGHDFIETGGDPESGRFDGECSRCGQTISGYW